MRSKNIKGAVSFNDGRVMDADFFKYWFLCIDGAWEDEGHDKSRKKTYTEQSVEHLNNSPLFFIEF